MTIREKVARAMMADTDDAPVNQWDSANRVTKDIYLGNTDVAIATFLAAAAEEGWRLVRDEATEEMSKAYRNMARAGDFKGNKHCLFDYEAYRAMLAASPKFELKE